MGAFAATITPSGETTECFNKNKRKKERKQKQQQQQRNNNSKKKKMPAPLKKKSSTYPIKKNLKIIKNRFSILSFTNRINCGYESDAGAPQNRCCIPA